MDRFSCRIEWAKEGINELEDRTIETTLSKQEIENRLRKNKEQNFSYRWAHNKRSNIYVTGDPEGEEKKRAKLKKYS